jgi:hypothetical protein
MLKPFEMNDCKSISISMKLEIANILISAIDGADDLIIK